MSNLVIVSSIFALLIYPSLCAAEEITARGSVASETQGGVAVQGLVWSVCRGDVDGGYLHITARLANRTSDPVQFVTPIFRWGNKYESRVVVAVPTTIRKGYYVSYDFVRRTDLPSTTGLICGISYYDWSEIRRAARAARQK